MSDPYRGGSSSAPSEPRREGGLVDELIAQFADPLAFYRELVQNSIDAGAQRISVTLAWEPDPNDARAGIAHASVRDDGCGMDRAILEDELTVLFRSGKEGQEGKIGKFGVGFVSVLAVSPALVTVSTSKGQGETWTLQLHPDQRYDLFRLEGGGQRGTTVTLELALAREAFDAFVEGSERALVRWCRHVELPLTFVAHVAGAEAPLREARIDRPLGLDALVVVDAREGGTRVIAGLPHDARAYVGFFNRGLLLHETTRELFGAVAVKIQDDRLEHTLSRDDVRRDAGYERAMRFARRVVEDDLAARARAWLDELAERRRADPPIDRLLAAVERAGLAVDGAVLRFPLLHPHGSHVAAPAAWLARDDCYGALASSELTRTFARQGGLVIDLSVAASPESYRAMLSALADRPLERIDDALVLAQPIEPSGSDLALLERLAAMLASVARAPADPRFVALAGARSFVVAGVDALPAAITHDEAARDPFRLLRRPPLWLDASAPVVAAARRAAEQDPDLAAALLARAVLLEHGSLDEARDDAWLATALARSERA